MMAYKLLAVGFAACLFLVALNFARWVPPQETPPGELSPAAKDGKWGYVNDKRKFVIEPQFDLASPFFEGLAAVKKGERIGYIDSKARMIVEPQFQVAGPFASGLAGARKEKKYGFIDRTGNFVIPEAFEAVGIFSEGVASAKSGGKYGYINNKGKWVIEPKYELAGPFSSGRASVKIDGKYGYVDHTGKLVIKPQFEWAGQFSEGLASVKVGSKYGFVNLSGEITIHAKYYRLSGPFSEGVCGASDEKMGKYGLIDKEGKLKIDVKFDAIGPFNKGLASAQIDGKPVFVSAMGETIGHMSQLVKIKFSSTPTGAALRITEEWRWFTATDKDYLFSTLEPRPEGNTDREIQLSKDTIYRVFFVLPGHPRLDRKVDPATTPQVMVSFP